MVKIFNILWKSFEKEISTCYAKSKNLLCKIRYSSDCHSFVNYWCYKFKNLIVPRRVFHNIPFHITITRTVIWANFDQLVLSFKMHTRSMTHSNDMSLFFNVLYFSFFSTFSYAMLWKFSRRWSIWSWCVSKCMKVKTQLETKQKKC